ncbi:MAG: peroxiredoxin, partial [Nocardioidaceae bacterium]|nr:peroxiredoxin [Nocardioidaceae bacterium]
MTTLTVGDPAPDFVLPDQHRSDFSMARWHGRKAVLLVFFPFAFSGVCTGELNGFR